MFSLKRSFNQWETEISTEILKPLCHNYSKLLVMQLILLCTLLVFSLDLLRVTFLQCFKLMLPKYTFEHFNLPLFFLQIAFFQLIAGKHQIFRAWRAFLTSCPWHQGVQWSPDQDWQKHERVNTVAKCCRIPRCYHYQIEEVSNLATVGYKQYWLISVSLRYCLYMLSYLVWSFYDEIH